MAQRDEQETSKRHTDARRRRNMVNSTIAKKRHEGKRVRRNMVISKRARNRQRDRQVHAGGGTW